jgi:hypothetical protein
MHWTRLAPLLSATSSWDCIWIMDPVPYVRLAGTSPAVPKNGHSKNWSGAVARKGPQRQIIFFGP